MTAERTDESQSRLAVEGRSHAPVAWDRQGTAPVMGDPSLRHGRKRLAQGLTQPLVDPGVLLVLGGDGVAQSIRRSSAADHDPAVDRPLGVVEEVPEV